MAWWVYKCNARNLDYQSAYGDWSEFFEKPGDHWGKEEWVPALVQLQKGDLILAYQTDRNELVGVVKVRRPCGRDGYLYLSPVQRIGTKVRALKSSHPKVAKIKAFKPGPIMTVYPIPDDDVRVLLRAAGQESLCRRLGVHGSRSTTIVPTRGGAGFGDPGRNPAVERAAVIAVRADYEARGWKVVSFEAANLGYDLHCTTRGNIEHVEVKGVSGSVPSFPITRGELQCARVDPRFVLKVVTNALDDGKRKIHSWSGRGFLKEFTATPMTFMARWRR